METRCTKESAPWRRGKKREAEQRGRLRPEAAAICGSRLYPTISRRADRVLCYATKLLPIIESPYYLDHLFVTNGQVSMAGGGEVLALVLAGIVISGRPARSPWICSGIGGG